MPTGEFVKTIAATVARTSRMPADGPQLAKSRAAVRTRWPSVPSIASTRELSPHSLSAPAVDVEGGSKPHAACAGACDVCLYRCPRVPRSTALANRKVRSTPRSAASATRSSSVSCIDLVIRLMCADQNASGVGASSARTAALKEGLLSVSGLWWKA